MLCQVLKVQRLLSSNTRQSFFQSYPNLSAHCHFRNEAAIIELCKQRRFEEALFTLHSLESKTLSRSTYAHLLAACASLKSLHHGRLIHRHLSSSGIPTDVVLHNHILIMYGKCRSMDDARQLFDIMPERNVVSWTSMISGYSQSNREAESVVMYLGMLYAGVLPDQFSLGSTIRSCSGLLDAELGMQLHCHVVKLGYESDLTVLNTLITMYSKTDWMGDAFMVFQSIRKKDLISWGAMIAGFSQQGHDLRALELFQEMISVGDYLPNEFHFGSALNACGNVHLLRYGEQMHSLCMKIGLEKYTCVGCALSDMYAKCGKLDCTRKAFYQVEIPDLVSWNSVIGAFASGGYVDEAIHFFSEMRFSGSKPDNITVLCLLCSCTIPPSLFQGQLIHAYLFKMSFGKKDTVCNAILNMYAKCSDVLRLSALMRCSKFEFDQVTLNSILSASADLACLEIGNQVHCNAFKSGFEDSLMVRNGLINMYTKCGNLNHARKLFELTGSSCDVYSWNSLMVGYAQFGYGRESLELFKRMQYSGIKPNHVTFVGVLSACSHIGLVDEGLHYYDMMSSTYDICPTREHCSCIVDLLSRAGRLSDAEIFIQKIPIEPDAIMWKTLLAASRVHNNMEIGKRAAERLLCVDPYNSAAYILLCNIYASSDCWDDLAKLRKSMKSHGVKKAPGRSWIEVKGEMNDFIAEDRSHQKTEDIYWILDLLGFNMSEVELDSLCSFQGSLEAC
ncbi:Pentatricopeptide repeat-containing protein [Platanthera zijinensis]|uniref:Pentatricopeptide repeat-containing protein n=1 Tax=Platanthera zijinensis TaxID=2320716 RepID=A0AAP0AZV3_9ASPA